MFEFIIHIICIMICTWQYLCKTMSNLWIDFSKQYQKIRGDSMALWGYLHLPKDISDII